MNEYYKAGHERLREVVSLHHYAIAMMLGLIREKEEAEIMFWNSLVKHFEEEIKNGRQEQ